jgi:diguanylate cyclase (GGDEF)-like protein
MDDLSRPRESMDNRLEISLRRELKRAARHKEPLSLILLECHIVDEDYRRQKFAPVFKQIATIIRRNIRDEDTEIILGRNVLLILPVTFLDGARIVASKIARQIQKSIIKGIEDLTDFEMHLIFGFSNFPADGSEREELLEAARTSLRNEKERLLKRLAAKKAR